MKRRALIAIAFALAAGVAVWTTRVPLLQAAGAFLIRDQPAQAADVIVVLGGSLPDRMLAAVDLYQQGLAPRIVFAREPPSPGMDELRRRGGWIPDRNELNLSISEQLGLPADAVVLLDGVASSTISEADVVLPYLRREGIRRVLLVTSKLHTLRAGLIYREFEPKIDFVTRATPYDPFDPTRWWHSPGHRRRVVIEYQKLALFQWRRLWGWGEAGRG